MLAKRKYAAVIRQDIELPGLTQPVTQHRVCLVEAFDYAAAMDEVLEFMGPDDDVVVLGQLEHVTWPTDWLVLADNLIVEPLAGQPLSLS